MLTMSAQVLLLLPSLLLDTAEQGNAAVSGLRRGIAAYPQGVHKSRKEEKGKQPNAPLQPRAVEPRAVAGSHIGEQALEGALAPQNLEAHVPACACSDVHVAMGPGGLAC